MMNRANNNGATTLAAAVEEMMRRFAQATVNTETGTETAENFDEKFNAVKAAFFTVLDEASRLTGLTNLKDRINRVYESGCTENGKKSMKLMTQECVRIIEEQARLLEDAFLYDEADMLKDLLKNGSIFQIFSRTVAFLAGKVYRFIRKGINKACSKYQVIDTMVKSIGSAAHLVLKGVKFVFKGASLAVSVVCAGTLKVADCVMGAFKWLCGQIRKGVNALIDKVFPYIDDEKDFDEFFEDEELELICPLSNAPCENKCCENCIYNPDAVNNQ